MDDLIPVAPRFEADIPVRQDTTPPPLASVVSHEINPILLENISTESEPLEWIWEGYIAKGHKTLLSALWKSGKSTLITTFLKALQEDEQFCGLNITPVKTLIVSEESNAEWAIKKEEFGINKEQSIWLLARQVLTKMNKREWTSFLKQIADFCKQSGIDLVIVDTLSDIWPVTDENNATDVKDALLPFNQLLTENIAVLMVHHHRKGGGDQGQAARGSGSLSADADVIVDFDRLVGDPNSTQRKLTSLSRFKETPRELVIEYSFGKYSAIGTLVEIAKEEKLRAVTTLLQEAKSGATADQIRSDWDTDEFGSKPSKRTILRYLQELCKQERVSVQSSPLATVPDVYTINKSRVTRQIQGEGGAPFVARTLSHDKTDVVPKISVVSHGQIKPVRSRKIDDSALIDELTAGVAKVNQSLEDKE